MNILRLRKSLLLLKEGDFVNGAIFGLTHHLV